MKKKKWLVMLLAVATSMSLMYGCGFSDSGQKEETETETQKQAASDNGDGAEEAADTGDVREQNRKIVYISRNLNDMYAAFLVKIFETKIDTDYPGWEMEVLDLQEDFAKNPDYIENAVTMGADGIIGQLMTVNPVDAARKVGEENGVEVAAFDALYPESEGALAMVNADNYRMGYMIGELAAEKLPENGRVCILAIGRKMDVVVQRDNGIADALAELRPDVEILTIGDIDFDKNVGIQIVTDWITQYGQLDGILGDSDTCALAAIEAYRAAGLDLEKTVFIGLDGGSDACNAIKNGELTGSVLQSAEQYAELTLQICADAFEGKIDPADGENQPSLTIDPIMITSETVDEYIELYTKYGLMK